MGKSQDLYVRAKKIIPGGTQLLSKRPEQFLPGFWPAYYAKAKGCEVWDLDGKKYVDMSYMGIGSCVLGYSDDEVNRAVELAVKRGTMCTLNAPEEVELAEELLSLHPWADMVRYARTGGEAMSLAVRIARAKTKKDTVLFCGYHGWHDWYLSSNLSDRKSLDGHLLPGLNPFGVPRALRGTSYPFAYNDTKAFIELIKRHHATTGAVILEAIRNDAPSPGFTKTIRALTRKYGIVLIIDEITSGWRLNLGGAHLLYGVVPDIAVFAKGISNGFPMAAVIGRRNVMETAQETFMSSTYWTDRIGPAAALASIRKMRKYDVSKHLVRTGMRIKEIWSRAAERYGLGIRIGGIDPLAHFEFQYKAPLVLKTLFTQEMLREGVLATTAFYAAFAHKEIHCEKYESAAMKAFGKIARALKKGSPERLLIGSVCHSGFKRLT